MEERTQLEKNLKELVFFPQVLYACCQGSLQLVLGNCISLRTPILIKKDVTCILPTGNSAREACFQENKGEERLKKQALANAFQNLGRKTLCSSWRRFLYIVASRFTGCFLLEGTNWLCFCFILLEKEIIL